MNEPLDQEVDAAMEKTCGTCLHRKMFGDSGRCTESPPSVWSMIVPAPPKISTSSLKLPGRGPNGEFVEQPQLAERFMVSYPPVAETFPACFRHQYCDGA